MLKQLFSYFSTWITVLTALSVFAVSAADIEVTVSPVSANYQNSQTIDYQVLIKNTSAKTLRGITVSDPIWQTKVESESGSVNAFSDLSIGASSSWGSKPGAFSSVDADLNVENAVLFPYGHIAYQVQANVSSEAIGEIVLDKATVRRLPNCRHHRYPLVR